jgi:hypothetical protein
VKNQLRLWSLLVLGAMPSVASAHREPLMCVAVAFDERDALSELASFPEPESSADDAMCLSPRSGPRKAAPPEFSAPLSQAQARASLAEADRLLANGQPADALLHLRVVELGVPRVADRIALERAAVLLQLGQPERACEAFAVAKQSPDRDVAVMGQVGNVRCALEAGKRRGEDDLRDWVRR